MYREDRIISIASSIPFCGNVYVFQVFNKCPTLIIFLSDLIIEDYLNVFSLFCESIIHMCFFNFALFCWNDFLCSIKNEITFLDW